MITRALQNRGVCAVIALLPGLTTLCDWAASVDTSLTAPKVYVAIGLSCSLASVAAILRV